MTGPVPGPRSSRVHVIAEAGTTHEGSLDRAIASVDDAAAAGADSVKFQIIHPEGLYLPEDPAGPPNAVLARRRRQVLPPEAWRAIADRARARSIPMSASVFDVAGIRLLEALDPPYVKIASCDLNHHRLLRAAGAVGRRIVLSTGMATLPEIERAVAAVLETGNERIVLMHCVSAYPAALETMNLGFITTLRKAFGLPVGLSDHTETSHAASMAIALGATWIEKHFTWDRGAEGFDHAYAMEPEGLRAFIADVRAAESAMCEPPEKIHGSEAEVKPRARRGVYAARPLPTGHVITDDDLVVVRPEGQIAAEDAERLVGRVVKREMRSFEALAWDAVT